MTKTAIKGAAATADWVHDATAESRESLQEIYQEAQAEHRASRARA